MMRTVTFFNKKGGTGKTTLSVLFGSWLAYCVGEEVFGMDFDFPDFQYYKMRETDTRLLVPGNAAFVKYAAGNRPYPLYKVDLEKGTDGKPDHLKVQEFIRSLRNRKAGGDGYLILDFPGQFETDSMALHFAKAGLIDLIVFPVDTDRQSRSAAMFVNSVLQSERMRKLSGKPEGQDVLCVWNRESRSERTGKRDWYGAYEEQFRALGMPVASTRMRDIVIARRDPDTFGFIRSTVCWPEANIRKACPYIHDLFREIKERLDKHC